MDRINNEIDAADYTTSDPDTIIKAKESGLVGEQVASMALGFRANEYKQAREDHMDRIIRIAEAQTSGSEPANGALKNPASRGMPDLSGDPAEESKGEKEASRNTDTKDSTAKPVRGEGKETKDQE
jgi:hypothetical protein